MNSVNKAFAEINEYLAPKYKIRVTSKEFEHNGKTLFAIGIENLAEGRNMRAGYTVRYLLEKYGFQICDGPGGSVAWRYTRRIVGEA